MVGILHSKNLVIVYTNSFLFFEWTLEESDLEKENTLQSPRFITRGETEKPSFLQLTVNSVRTLYLYLWNPKFVENGRYVLTITDKKRSPIHTHIAQTNPIDIPEKIDLFISISDIPSSTEYPIIVSCTVTASALQNESSEATEQLSLDFKTIYDQSINTDIVLKVDGDSIKAHKLVLAARSPVFSKMFHHDSSESTENEVVIMDIGSATMKKLVSFLYAATNEKCNFEETMELYYAADKYEVLSLRDVCKMELLNDINVNNACPLFMLANRHNDEDFKKKVVKFICGNFKSLVNMESLNSMSKEDIISLITLCAPNMK